MTLPFRRGSDQTGSELFERLKRFFEEDEWHPQPIEGQEALQMGFNGKNGRWRCIAAAFKEQEQVTFYAILDTQVPFARRRLAGEYLTRANYGLRLGNFEMDFDDGEVRCRAGIDVEGGELSEADAALRRIRDRVFDRERNGEQNEDLRSRGRARGRVSVYF